jgi:PAS domain S-box-containing protein
MAAAAAAVYILNDRWLAPLPGATQLPAPIFAVLFGLAEVYVFRLYVRRQAHVFSLSEFPLVIGLFFVSPGALVLARLAGSAAALVLRRRNSPVKLAFNLGLFALETLLAIAIFRLVLASSNPMGHGGWVAALVAVLAASGLGALMTHLAIALAEPKATRPSLRSVLLLGIPGAAANASLGLVAVTVAWHDLQAVGLLVIPLLTFFFAYRAYASERQKHQNLERLYRFSRQLQGLREPETIVGELLWQSRDMFRAEMAEAVIFGGVTGPEWLTVRLGRSEELDVSKSLVPDPLVADLSQAVLGGRTGITRERGNSLHPYLVSRGASTAMLVPLRGESAPMGVLMVANRLGTRTSFASEEWHLLETIASRAGMALENARLGDQLHEAEARSSRLGRILDESAMEFYIADATTLCIQQASRAATERQGYSQAELQAMTLSDILVDVPSYRLAGLVEPLRRAGKGQLVLETIQRRREGGVYPVEVRFQLTRAEDPPLLLVIAQDISERKRAQEAVRESQAKSHFLATMSHELRTPLNSILGFAQLLAGGGFGVLTDRQSRYVANIESSGHQLLDLINDILDLSKIEAGRMEVSPEVVNMAGLLDDCLTKIRPLAEPKAIELEFDVPAEVRVWADARRLRQVILNLLSNAVKFTPAEGTVRVVARQSEESMQLDVTDTGIGIAPEHLATIFNEFTQIDSTLSRESTGTGLGLPLSRKLVTLMGGTLSVNSRLGLGSTFTVQLPAEPS